MHPVTPSSLNPSPNLAQPPSGFKELLENEAPLSEFQNSVSIDQIHNMLIEGSTLLGWACSNGRTDVVEWLLDSHANIEAPNGINLFTPLHLAATHGQAETVECLLRRGASKERLSSDGITPLFLAAQKGNIDCVRILLQYQAKVDSDNLTMELSPLHTAAYYCHDDVIRLLLENGASIDKLSKMNKTPLFFAANQGRISTIKTLLDYHPNIDSTNERDWTAVHLAAHKGHAEALELLLSRGALKERYTTTAMTPLYLAAAGGHDECVKVLLKFGANIDCPNTLLKMMPLHIAAYHGHEKVLRLLLANKALIEAYSEDLKTPLFIAASEGKMDAVGILLEHRALIDSPNIGDSWTPLQGAAHSGYGDTVRLLLANGASATIYTVSGSSAIHLASLRGNTYCVKALLDQIDVNYPTLFNQWTPLHFAAYNGNEETLKLLLEKGATTEALTGTELSTALYLAANQQKTGSVKILLNFKANINSENTKDKLTPLHIAAHMGYQETLDLLIKEQASLTSLASDGSTALGFAIKGGKIECVQKLLDAGVSIESSAGPEGWTPLCLSVYSNQIEILRSLLKRGANTETINQANTTALGWALWYNKSEAVAVLLDHGAQLANALIEWRSPIASLINKESPKMLEDLGDHLIKQLKQCVEEFQEAFQETGYSDQFYVAGIANPLSLLRVIGNISILLSGIDPNTNANFPPKLQETLTNLFTHYSEKSIFPIGQIIQSTQFQNVLRHFLEEKIEEIEKNKDNESSLSKLHPQIREFNIALRSCLKFYPLLFSPSSIAIYQKSIQVIHEEGIVIHEEGMHLEEKTKQQLSLLKQQDKAKREKEFDSKDAFILLAEFGLGVADEKENINAAESYLNLIHCEAVDLFNAGIQTGQDLRALGIDLSLKNLCNKIQATTDFEMKQQLWKKLSEKSQIIAEFLHELSLPHLVIRKAWSNLEDSVDSLVKRTDKMPSEEEEKNCLNEIIASHKKYAQSLLSLYISQGAGKLEELLKDNNKESLADWRMTHSQSELFSLIPQDDVPSTGAGKKRKNPNQN